MTEEMELTESIVAGGDISELPWRECRGTGKETKDEAFSGWLCTNSIEMTEVVTEMASERDLFFEGKKEGNVKRWDAAAGMIRDPLNARKRLAIFFEQVESQLTIYL